MILGAMEFGSNEGLLCVRGKEVHFTLGPLSIRELLRDPSKMLGNNLKTISTLQESGEPSLRFVLKLN